MKQLSLPKSNSWGGYRQGAGRKKSKNKAMQNHVRRPEVSFKIPLHITLRLRKGLSGLRSNKGFKIFYKAVLKARKKSLNVIHFSIQGNHLHLIVEAKNKEILGKAMQSFCTCFARLYNSWKQRSGGVFADRYHAHLLKTPREVKNAIRYVLLNASKHMKKPAFLDRFSSGLNFQYWDTLLEGGSLHYKESIFDGLVASYSLDLLMTPRSWLLDVGWRRSRRKQ